MSSSNSITSISVKRCVDGDEGWQRVKAMLLVLPLDPRVPLDLQRTLGRRQRFMETPMDWLMRHAIWQPDGSFLYADHYSCYMRFSACCNVLLRIGVEDSEALGEFKRVVGAAMEGVLYKSSVAYWQASQDRASLEAKGKVFTEPQQAAVGLQGRTAWRYLDLARSQLAIERPNCGGASAYTHEQVLERMLKWGVAALSAGGEVQVVG